MKGYKAFKKGLICDPTGNKPFQFAENTVFEQDEEAAVCKSGFHFCENPLDTLDYYPLIDRNGELTEFAEVEALDEVKTEGNKSVTRKLKIGAKLSLGRFIKASFDFMYESIRKAATNTRTKNADELIKAGGSYSQLAGGYNSQLAGGYNSQLAGGSYSKLAGGSYSKLAGGSYSKLAGGDNSQLAGGSYSKLAGGDNSQLAGGYNSQLAGGSYSQLAGGYNSQLAGGSYSKLAGGYNSQLAGGYNSQLAGGKHSVMIGDNDSIAKGKKGALIVLVAREWQNGEYVIKSFKAEIVDGERIKEDTPYKLVNGEFVEV